MESLTMVQAIAAAASAESAPPVAEAYAAVKELLASKFSDEPMVTTALHKVEHEPEKWSPTLETALDDVNAPDDSEINAAVEKLIAALRDHAPSGDVFGDGGTKITHTGTGDVVMGDKAGGNIDKSKKTINTGGGSFIGGNVTYHSRKDNE